MDRQTLLVLMQRRPFEPFALQLSSGQVVEVRHPEMAALGKSRIVIFDSETDDMEIVSLLHVTSIRTAQAA